MDLPLKCDNYLMVVLVIQQFLMVDHLFLFFFKKKGDFTYFIIRYIILFLITFWLFLYIISFTYLHIEFNTLPVGIYYLGVGCHKELFPIQFQIHKINKYCLQVFKIWFIFFPFFCWHKGGHPFSFQYAATNTGRGTFYMSYTGVS